MFASAGLLLSFPSREMHLLLPTYCTGGGRSLLCPLYSVCFVVAMIPLEEGEERGKLLLSLCSGHLGLKYLSSSSSSGRNLQPAGDNTKQATEVGGMGESPERRARETYLMHYRGRGFVVVYNVGVVEGCLLHPTRDGAPRTTQPCLNIGPLPSLFSPAALPPSPSFHCWQCM